MQIYIHRSGQTIGPFTLDGIKQGLQANQFTLADLAHVQGGNGWKSLHETLSELRNAANAGSSAIAPSNVQNAAEQTWQDTQNIPNQANASTSGLLSNPVLRAFLNEEQDPSAVTRVYDRLTQICTPEEQTLYIAVQKKPVVTIAPTSVALTNKRVIIFRPQALGLGLSFEDYPWRSVVNIHIKEVVLGSQFFVKLLDGRQVFVDSLPKAQARRLYQFGQQMEEHMNHHRRELMLEEKRAGAGGVNVAVGMNPQSYSPQSQSPVQQQAPQALPEAPTQPMLVATEDPVEKLGKLKAMLERSLISQAEYDSKKAEIMARF